MLFPFSFDSPNSLNTVPHKEVFAQAKTCTTPRCSSPKKRKAALYKSGFILFKSIAIILPEQAMLLPSFQSGLLLHPN